MLSGLTIKAVRRMTRDELGEFDWHRGTVVEFHGGLLLFSATDSAQNNPGTFCGRTRDGRLFELFAVDGDDVRLGYH